MKSHVTRSFREHYRRLPQDVRQQAREAYRRFKSDPSQPGLAFKRIHGKRDVVSARVGEQYRALGQRLDGVVVWFWIGTHAEYDAVIRRL